MLTSWWPLENRVSGAKGQSVRLSRCPAVRGGRVVLGLNGLRVSTVGLRAMLVPLPWALS